MKKRISNFCIRGLICSGFGPVVYGIVMFILFLCGIDTLSNGLNIFKGIMSTYLLAFIVAGMTIIWQEDRLGLGLSIFIHGFVLYLCYLGMYLINGWLLSNNILIFSLIFILGYGIIWVVIYIVEKYRVKKLNHNFEKNLFKNVN